jgi:decaprenylphospho-beta-D-erythro-pentofuranosid-2-ulose 2-reductase
MVLGASSGIGCAVAAELARTGHDLVIGSRDTQKLERIAADLRLRHGVDVRVEAFDALDFASHRPLIERCAGTEGDLAGIVLSHGYMATQEKGQSDFETARRTIDVNFTSCVSVCEAVAEFFVKRGDGVICVVSSVAGDRGRQSNYIYGSSKAGLTAYLQGLRNRLAPSKVAVVTVKPGFVDTPMTYGLLKPGSRVVASPQRVAADICRGMARRKDVIYTPWFWRIIMTIICSIPERVFKKLKT